MSKNKKKEYITYKTYYQNNNDNIFIQDCMNLILKYTTKRFAYLKKHNLLGTYDKDDCDDYRKAQFYEDENKVEHLILDARYARAIDKSIQAKCDSLIKCKQNNLESKLIKLEQLQNEFDKAQEKYHNSKVSKYSEKEAYKNLEYKNKVLQKITSKIETLQYEINNKIYNGIVFGGKKLFKEQFKENINFEIWKEKWHNRGNEFECGGSKSENYGNKQFQLKFSKTIKNKHYFDLHVNVPYQLREKYGSVYILKNIYFPRGNDILKQNHDNNVAYFKDLNNYNNLKKKLEKENKSITGLQKPNIDDYYCDTVSFLIKKHYNGKMGIHASIPRKIKQVITEDRKGVIGIDINYDNISLSEINHLGKLLHSKVYKFNFGSNNKSGYREQMINKAIKEIVLYAKEKKKHLVIENLDFFKTKMKQLKKIDKKYNRMLHSLAYAKIKERIRINCLLQGVVSKAVDAAYTSMLGKTLYTKKYGISVHQAAAYVIARRYYKLEEYYEAPKIEFIYKDKSCSLTIPVDIYKKQDVNKKAKTTNFYKELYRWLSSEFKAPSRFYKKALTS